MAMGEDDCNRGNLDAALSKFREATRTTAALLVQRPDNAETIFAHAQSVFWIGFVHYQRAHYGAALQSFRQYRQLANRLVAIDPADPRWLREASYASGNLCSVALEGPVDVGMAMRSCRDALAAMQRVAERVGQGNDVLGDLANRHAWLADAYRAAGDIAQAYAQRMAQERIVDRLRAQDPHNMDLRDIWLTLQIAMASYERIDGNIREARQRLSAALAVSKAMTRFDPGNREWAKRRDRIVADLGHVAN